jgi:hypothetical protein
MTRIIAAFTGASRSRSAADWIAEVNAAFVHGSLIAGAFRLGIVACVRLARLLRTGNGKGEPR